MRKKPIRTIPLLGSCQVNRFAVYEKVMKNMISLTTDERIYLFSADTEAEMNSWYEVLYSAIENTRNDRVPPLGGAGFNDDDDDDIYDVLHSQNTGCTDRHDSLDSQLSVASSKITPKKIVEEYKVSGNEPTEDPQSEGDDDDAVYVNTAQIRNMRHDSGFSQFSTTSDDTVASGDISPYFISQTYQQGNAVQESGGKSMIYEDMEVISFNMLRNRSPPVKPPRRHTDNLVKVQTSDDNGSDKRAYTIATSDGSDVKPRLNGPDVKSRPDEPGLKPRPDGHYVNQESIDLDSDRTSKESKKKFDIKYSLNMSDESLFLSLLNPVEGASASSDICSTKDGLCITYGQYEINIRSR